MKLHLEDNEIGSIEGLEKLFSLEVLNLERNRLKALGKGLAKLSKLREQLARTRKASKPL